ncbi:MAG: glycosyltransferase family 9 protein [Bacteroidota bacterium]|nr:glycosyltransferase family 9 protein [Bacteroidota bacterium]
MIIEKDKVRKILCIKLRGIGDVILSTVVFNNLRKDFPNAKIDFLTESPSKAALEKLPFLNEIIVLDKKRKNSSLYYILKVRSGKYDLVLDFYSNPRTALITFLSGAKYKAGFPYKGRTYAYNLFGPQDRDKFHAAKLHLEFLKSIGLSYSSDELFFSLGQEDISFAENYFNETFDRRKPVAGISPSGGWASKKCDPEKFAEIADAISRRFSSEILLLWGPGDKSEADAIASCMKEKVHLAPATDIRKMGAMIKKCSFIVANDSGPMHIATAVKTPTLSLHGPTDPKLQGPFGDRHEYLRLDDLDCIGCNLLDCPKEHECFKNLPVDSVLGKIESLIKKNKIVIPLNEKS